MLVLVLVLVMPLFRRLLRGDSTAFVEAVRNNGDGEKMTVRSARYCNDRIGSVLASSAAMAFM
jgi:hypothetical protein